MASAERQGRLLRRDEEVDPPQMLLSPCDRATVRVAGMPFHVPMRARQAAHDAARGAAEVEAVLDAPDVAAGFAQRGHHEIGVPQPSDNMLGASGHRVNALGRERRALIEQGPCEDRAAALRLVASDPRHLAHRPGARGEVQRDPGSAPSPAHQPSTFSMIVASPWPTPMHRAAIP